MSLSVKESRLTAVNRLRENALQTVLQGKIELPATAAAVERVVWLKGTPILQSVATDQDRVYVQGAIDLAMIYVPEVLEGDSAGLRRLEWPGALPFDIYVDVVGAEPGMFAEGKVEILICEWEKSGQYAFDLDLILAVKASVLEVKEYTIISEANITKPAKLTREEAMLVPNTRPLELSLNREISNILELPADLAPMAMLLDLECQPKITEREISGGKIVLRGTVDCDLLYEANDLTVLAVSLPKCLPFEFSLEDEGIAAGMVAHTQLTTHCSGRPVNEGQAVRLSLQLKGAVCLQARQAVPVLTEINSTGAQVEVRKELLGVDNFVNEKIQEGSCQGLVEVGQQFPPIRELLRSTAKPRLAGYSIEEDKISIEGVFDLELYYLAHSEEDVKPLHRGVFPEAIAFQQTIALQGLEPGMQPQITVEMVEVAPDLINRETVEVALSFRTEVVISEYLEIEGIVEAVQVEPAEEDPPSLTYVFVQRGDTVWKLARQYHTTEEAIFQANPFLQELSSLLKAGDKIRIPR